MQHASDSIHIIYKEQQNIYGMSSNTNNHPGFSIAALIILSVSVVITGCATNAPEPKENHSSQIIQETFVEAPVLLAKHAYIHKDQLFIRYRSETEAVHNYAILPETADAIGSSTSTSIALQQAYDRYNGLPVAQLLYITPDTWNKETHNAQGVPVFSVAFWHEFRNRIFTNITPKEQHTGIIVEFLKQEELFYYYNEFGILNSVPVNDKPAHYKTVDTFTFRELLADAIPLIEQTIPAINGNSTTAVLFNTGDDADSGYPFIFADTKNNHVAFLHRATKCKDCKKSNSNTKPDAMIHTATSHLGVVFTQPVGSIARLFTLVSFKVVDTVTPKPVILLKDQPIPLVSNAEPMATEAWEQRLDGIAYSPVSQGTIEYLVDGEAFFARLIDAIQQAEESVDIRLYIFDNDDYALKIADLLKKRSKEINIRVLIDGIGTFSAASAYPATMPDSHSKPPRIIHYLEENSNIHVRTVMNPWLTGDHTKTILIDSKLAFLGGMNIGREYRYEWHDLMMELRGPVVDEIQIQFEKAWKLQAFMGDMRSTFHKSEEPVNKPQPNDIPIRLLFTKPGDSQILRAQLAAIANAQQRIYIQNAYFTSDDMIFELAMARRRGVDVRVILPYLSDSGLIDRSNVKAINAMLKNGIRVYIYPGPSHIKGAIYDNWICLGSANFDQLSLRMNKELNIATSDPVAVQDFLDLIFLPDFEKSIELKEELPEKWLDTLKETIADQL